jgi:hypothetical protein
MVQPKVPPLSIRPGEVRLAKIDAYALKHGLKRHAAVLELIDVGLDGLMRVAVQRPTPKPVPGSDAAARKIERAEAPEPFKTRLKGEWSPPGGKKR